MKIAIYGRMTEKTDTKLLSEFFLFLQEQKIDYKIDPRYAGELKNHLPDWNRWMDRHLFESESDISSFNFAYSMGGDGTLLNTIRLLEHHNIPILGVNFGRLGFLTSVMAEHLIDATKDIMRDMHRIDQRSAIMVESNPPGLFGEFNFGLNDLTIHKSNTNEMITVHTYINGEFLNSYWGDGLIIATPTGSTAYSLSCGGPIIHPQASAFVITPVAPHSLTVRPMILPDEYVISFEIESRSGQAMVALDTRTELVNEKIEIAIRKSDFNVKLVRVTAGKYLEMLRERLMWGRDSRN